MNPGFVHLSLHTEFSLVDGILRIGPLIERTKALGMPAVAVTDRANLFCMVRFYRAAVAAGIKPIIGIDLPIEPESNDIPAGHLTLLAMNGSGYRQLTRLLTRCYMAERSAGVPVAARAWVSEHAGDVIAISPGPGGDVGQALLHGPHEEAERRADAWASVFPGRFYLGVQRTGRGGDEPCFASTVDLALAKGLPVVAGNDVRFLERDDFEAHEARVCIQEGRVLADPRRPRSYSDEQYLKSPVEMAALFEDIPEALDNAVEIARRCSLEVALDSSHLPEFPVPEGHDLDEWFAELSRAGLARRLGASTNGPGSIGSGSIGPGSTGPGSTGPGSTVPCSTGSGLDVEAYRQRLELELDIICRMGYPGYFLIVADFIRWAREQRIPVGPGRGSGAGSLVAYALGITDLDPIHYDLLFERFLNPERVSLPDFDIDFCMEGRDRVIDYVASRYSADHVAQIITFGTMAAKAVVRDVGRVFGHPYGFVDQIAKLIPFELGMTLDRALAEAGLKERYEADDDVRTIIDLARKLEGLARNAGRHAGGVVIAPKRLTEFTALYREPGAEGAVTQFDKDDIEAVGLVKFDFLGLRTLTIIDWTLSTINDQRRAAGEDPLDLETLPTDDPATYELVRTGATTAVFQLESRGMKDLIRRLQPDCFDDLIALVALFRPGPLQSGMVDDFIDRKHGRAQVEHLHPEIASVLRPTYGVILYQEQVMKIAQVLAGYTLGEADLLRRAMGKKKPEEMAKHRSVFVDGATSRGVAKGTATHIFDLMEKFAGYGFNKSHSAAYALLSYQTAWLKTHHPAAFMAAVLSADMDSTDKVVNFVEESRALGLDVAPPHVNECVYRFSVADARSVRYGLGAIKGAGEAALEGVIEERVRNGPYRDLFDFTRRIDHKRVNRRVVEALIRAGALDGLGPSRASMMLTLTNALQAAEQLARNISTGQDDMFGSALASAGVESRFEAGAEWSEEERLAGEKETLGLYLTGHPITRFEPELEKFVSARLCELQPSPGQTRTIAGLVTGLRTINTRGGRMAIATLDDRTSRIEVRIYSELFANCRELLVKDRLLVVEGEIEDDEFSGGCSVVASAIHDLEATREQRARHILIELDGGSVDDGLARTLREAIESYRAGSTPICIDYRRRDARARLALGGAWAVRPADDLIARLRDLAGAERVRIEY